MGYSPRGYKESDATEHTRCHPGTCNISFTTRLWALCSQESGLIHAVHSPLHTAGVPVGWLNPNENDNSQKGHLLLMTECLL